MQLTELRESQIAKKDINLHYVKTHNAVIKNVLEHKDSFGFVRSGELEAYCTTNHIDLSRFNIIRPKILDGEDTGQFPYAVSTRLYPEWPFVALPYVEESVIQDVAVALLTMNQYANPNSPGEMLSWATPSSYMKAKTYLSAIETNSERVHTSIEFLGFLILSGIMASVLIAAAERGRRRRNVTFHLTNFFPCVLAALPSHTAIIIIILLIGAIERSAEAFIRDRGFGSSYLNTGLGLATFIGVAISAHFVSGPTTERSITLEKLEEILQEIADKTSPWEKLEEYCRSHNITEDEFDSIEARFQAMRKPRQTPVDLSKHRDKWKG